MCSGCNQRCLGVLFFCAMLFLTAIPGAQAAGLRLAWQASSSNHSGFKIERLNGASYVEIASVAANVLAYSDGNLSAGVNYCYRVRAFNTAGVSEPSSAVCANAPSDPATAPAQPASEPVPPTGGSGTGTGTDQPSGEPASGGAKDWRDYLVDLKMRSADDDALGVLFRYQDKDNYYRFSWFAEGKYRRLEKRVDGVFHVLAEDTAVYNTGQTYALQISAKGSSLNVAIDGQPVLSATDDSFKSGTVALYSYYNAGSYFAQVRVQDLVTGDALLADDFAAGDYAGWTIIDEGNYEGPSVWAVVDGALAQTSNIGFNGGDNGRRGTYALYTRGDWADYRFALKMRSGDDDRLGVMFRVQDRENFYRFSWDRGSPGRKLWKREKGAYTLLAEDAVPYEVNQTYAVEIIAQGSTLKVNIDGNPVFSVTDPSFPAGTVALYASHNENSYFDDLLIEDLATKSVLLWNDFSNGKLTGWDAFDDPGTTLGPSDWSVVDGAVVQGSNIGSDAAGHPGTFLLY